MLPPSYKTFAFHFVMVTRVIGRDCGHACMHNDDEVARHVAQYQMVNQGMLPCTG